MKIIFTILLIKSIIFASSDLNTSSLDMFLFKIGFTSLTSEFEELKTITNKNTNAILKLESRLNNINDTSSKNKISNSIIIHDDNNNDKKTISNLQKKVALLEKKLTEVLNKNSIIKRNTTTTKKEIKSKHNNSNIIKNLPYKYATISFNNVKVHYYPKSKSMVTKLLKKSTLIKIQYCNKYHWCKVYKKHEYIAQIRLKF